MRGFNVGKIDVRNGKLNGFTSLENDNMFYVSFRIREQECVPWYGEIQNQRFVLVAVDYFTKWVEAEALANIRDLDVKKFLWRNIVMRFRVPESLVSDNEL